MPVLSTPFMVLKPSIKDHLTLVVFTIQPQTTALTIAYYEPFGMQFITT